MDSGQTTRWTVRSVVWVIRTLRLSAQASVGATKTATQVLSSGFWARPSATASTGSRIGPTMTLASFS